MRRKEGAEFFAVLVLLFLSLLEVYASRASSWSIGSEGALGEVAPEVEEAGPAAVYGLEVDEDKAVELVVVLGA